MKAREVGLFRVGQKRKEALTTEWSPLAMGSNLDIPVGKHLWVKIRSRVLDRRVGKSTCCCHPHISRVLISESKWAGPCGGNQVIIGRLKSPAMIL